jgi:hypothetical protein
MLSPRTRSLLLSFCAFIALFVMNGSAAVHAHVRVDALLHGAAQSHWLAADMHVTSDAAAWQKAVDDRSDCDGFLQAGDSDADDEPVLPSPTRVALHYLPSAAPLSASADLYHAPATSLLRPPSVA